MGLLDDAKTHLEPDADDPAPTEPRAETARIGTRQASVKVGGEAVEIDPTETTHPTEDGGTWLTASESHGRPRGVEALEHREIAQTAAMQSIINGIAGQIIGGDLAAEVNEEVMEDLSSAEQSAARDFKDLYMDVLKGPHLPNLELDQMITAAVADMVGPGQAVWQFLSGGNGSVPVVAMKTLDPLTIRMNITRNNTFGDPPYWQAQSPVSGGVMSGLSSSDPTPLQHDDIAVMDYPYGTRSNMTYPRSPAWQVKEWLEILANSTTHHNRFYSDNEIPPGLIQIVNASGNTVEDVKQKIQDASGDPRDVPIIGGEGGAQWLDMGGTSVNLNIIEEQRFFFFMCLGALGLGKQEVGFVEDVNRSNGEIEATRVYKRLAGPFINQFEHAFKKGAKQFDIYSDLGKPFVPTIKHSDPRAEQAKEQRLREQLQAGAITPRQYARRSGDEDLAEDDERWQIEVDGEIFRYGDHPTWVGRRVLSALLGGEASTVEPDEGEQAIGVGPKEPTPMHNGGGESWD